MENISKDKLVADMKVVLTDVEELLKAATAATGETAAGLREKAAEKLRVATRSLTELQDAALVKGKEAARVTDDYVHANPWQAAGVALAAGFFDWLADQPPVSWWTDRRSTRAFLRAT